MSNTCIATGTRNDLSPHRAGTLFDQVAVVLSEADPLAFIGGCTPQDYAPAVETILRRLSISSSVSDVENIVYEEFLRWFGAGITGPREKYGPIARVVWRLWNDLAPRIHIA